MNKTNTLIDCKNKRFNRLNLRKSTESISGTLEVLFQVDSGDFQHGVSQAERSSLCTIYHIYRWKVGPHVMFKMNREPITCTRNAIGGKTAKNGHNKSRNLSAYEEEMKTNKLWEMSSQLSKYSCRTRCVAFQHTHPMLSFSEKCDTLNTPKAQQTWDTSFLKCPSAYSSTYFFTVYQTEKVVDRGPPQVHERAKQIQIIFLKIETHSFQFDYLFAFLS